MIVLSRPLIGDEEIQGVIAVLRSGLLATGLRVTEFEQAFASVAGARHAVAVGSGTAALHIGLLAMGVGPGDEVIVPSFTFAATANTVRLVGAEPVFADVDPGDFTIHAESVKRAVTRKTRAIMPVHLFGQPALMSELLDLAADIGVDVIEDAAQAHLSATAGRRAGSMGRFGAFSFYPTKNMTTGEGGMITTSDSDLAEKARMLRNQGMSTRYEHELIGLNERMTEIEGAIGLAQLRKLEEWTKRRRDIAEIYRQHLDARLGLPLEREDAYHVYHQFTLTPPDRQPVIAALEESQIGYGIYYAKATHQQNPYVGPAYQLPVTEELTRRVVSIPIRPDLEDHEIGRIIETLNGLSW